MKILGIGVDVIKNKRIQNLINKKSFINRTFGKNEVMLSKKSSNKTNYFAKRFAAKEAFAKSLGTGISGGLSFKEIEIKSNKLGKPTLQVVGKSLKVVKKVIKNKKFYTFLSISDDKPFAIAIIILTTK